MSPKEKCQQTNCQQITSRQAMTHCKRLKTNTDKLFPFCWELYLSAFPDEERRELDYHVETMRLDQFHCDVVLDVDVPIAILFWWDLKEFTFIEHLATTPAVRGRGYGDQILREFILDSKKPVLLEVEHPTNDICRRRIGFYERIGFILNEHQYRHPSYQQIKDKFVDLMVMTYPKAITNNELQNFTRNEFPAIHFRSFL